MPLEDHILTVAEMGFTAASLIFAVISLLITITPIEKQTTTFLQGINLLRSTCYFFLFSCIFSMLAYILWPFIRMTENKEKINTAIRVGQIFLYSLSITFLMLGTLVLITVLIVLWGA